MADKILSKNRINNLLKLSLIPLLLISTYLAITPITEIKDQLVNRNRKIQLKYLSICIEEFYKENRHLPKSLKELTNWRSSINSPILYDTKDEFQHPLYYKVINPRTFEIAFYRNRIMFKTKDFIEEDIGIHRVKIITQ